MSAKSRSGRRPVRTADKAAERAARFGTAVAPEPAKESPGEPPKPGVAPEVVADWVLAVGAVVIGCLIAAFTALFAAFLSPFRIGDALVPVSWAVVVLGAAAAVIVAGYGSGRTLAMAVPALVWFGVTMPLSTRTSEGDLAIPGNWVGYGLIFIGIPAFAGSAYLVTRLLNRSGA